MSGLIQSPGFIPQRYVIDPPFHALDGDTFEIEENTIYQVRGHNRIDLRELPAPEEIEEFGVEAQEVSEVVLLRRKAMPAAAATLTNCVKSESGAVTFFFSDDTSQEFASISSALSNVSGHDSSAALAKQLLMLAKLRRDPLLQNANDMNGSTCVVDGAAGAPVLMNLQVGVGGGPV